MNRRQAEEESMEKALKGLDLSFGYGDWLCYTELNQGVLRLDEAIREDSCGLLLREMDYIGRRQLPEVNLIINSGGGGAYYAFAIYDGLRNLATKGAKITARVEGFAASAAAMIVLQAADVRQARPHARFLLHEARRWIFWAVERTSDLKDEVKEMEAITEQIINILATRCGKKPSEVEAFIERKEIWMSASEALQWHLIDEIV